MSQEQRIYRDLARFYDTIYMNKVYRLEVESLKSIFYQLGVTPRSTKKLKLLDLACGTGGHVKFLRDEFDVTGVDINSNILEIAEERYSDVRFLNEDMTKLNLSEKFSIIICMFSSIGYITNKADLEKALINMAEHLEAGGILVIEPWFTKDLLISEYQADKSIESSSLRILKTSDVIVKEFTSMHKDRYDIYDKLENKSYVYDDLHELRFFEHEFYTKVLGEHGVDADFHLSKYHGGRGLVVGTKK